MKLDVAKLSTLMKHIVNHLAALHTGEWPNYKHMCVTH